MASLTDTVRQMITELEALRGTQDQTMRCGIIRIIHGTEKVNGLTPTQRFLEDSITSLKTALRNSAQEIDGR